MLNAVHLINLHYQFLFPLLFTLFFLFHFMIPERLDINKMIVCLPHFAVLCPQNETALPWTGLNKKFWKSPWGLHMSLKCWRCPQIVIVCLLKKLITSYKRHNFKEMIWPLLRFFSWLSMKIVLVFLQGFVGKKKW